MKREILLPIIFFLPVLVIQLTIVPFISIDYITPDLILILLVYYTLKNGQMFGTLSGAVFGLLFDLFSGGLIGSGMFAKTLVGFIAGYFFNENKTELYTSTLNFTLIIFLCAFIDSLFYGIFGGESGLNMLFLIFDKSLLPALYTAVISSLILILKSRKSFA